MKIDEYISFLRKKEGVIITVQDGELKIRANKNSLTQTLLAEIKSKKKEILTYFSSLNSYTQGTTIPLAVNRTFYPLSSIQRRLYFIQELDKNSTAYNQPSAIVLEGKINMERLQSAFDKLITRHEILRTSFINNNGEVVQKIRSFSPVNIITQTCNKNEVNGIFKEFIQPFNLENDSFLRIKLLTLKPEVSILLTDMHHIISDGVSQSIIIKEFMTLYHEETLSEVKLQYKDYVLWQESEEQQKLLKDKKTFWLHQFAEETTSLKLPTDYPRPKNRSFEGDSVEFALNTMETQSLKKLAVNQGTTLYTLILAALNILLYKLSNQEDIVIGTPTSGREHTDLETILGVFVNTLPLRNRPKGNISFINFLSEVKENTLACFDNQAYQYEDLLNALNVVRDTSRNPLFDVMFTYQNYDTSDLVLNDLVIKPFEVDYFSSLFDFHVIVFEKEDHLEFHFTYQTVLFERKSIERFATYFKAIINEIVANPEKKLADIEVLSEAEKLQLEQFNNTKVSFPDKETIVSLFEKQAIKTPENTAIKFGEKSMIYSELKESSDKIAYYLKEYKNVKRGDFVGIMLEREFYMLPFIFGILKAGAAYVPIAPDFPVERIHTIIDDTNLKAIITRQEYLQKALSISKELIVDVEEYLNTDIGLPKQKEDIPIDSSDIAYVIYTSGSTGKPKGVMIEHKSVVNRILWMQKKYPLTEEDVLLQKTAIVFDVSVWELFWWSFVGASICVLQPEEEKNPLAIMEAIEYESVTTIHFVPSMFAVFLLVLDENSPSLKSLKRVFTSGEALSISQVNQFKEKIYQPFKTGLINLYGPTEATVDVSYYECHFNEEIKTVPIGKPIDNIRLYIVGNYGEVVPIGVPGELCIAGVGLARGYMNNEVITNERFVFLPNIKEKRVYKTGDIAKWLSDGNIEFLGRKDNQVKIRGYRIELGEIEHQLMTHPFINQVAVLVKEDESTKYLVAYYVEKEFGKLKSEQIEMYLKKRLPKYMVPSFFIALQEMPLNVSGKINRKMLPDIATPTLSQAHIAPRNEAEAKMVHIWNEVLGFLDLGINDNFFRVGGDSIKAIKLIYEINKELNSDFSVADMYSYQTIEDLVVLLPERCGDTKKEFELAKKEIEEFENWYTSEVGFDDSIEAVYPMSSVEKGMTYYTLLKSDDEDSFHNILYHEQNLYRIAWEGFDFEIFKKAIALLMEKHSALRKVYDIHNFAHIVKKQIEPELYYIDISHLPLEDRIAFGAKKMNEERVRATDFSGNKPLWRMNLIKARSNFHYMLFDMHHSVFDGWSLHAFLTELKNSYIFLEKDENYKVEKLKCSYYDHILSEIVESNSTKSNNYWKHELDGYSRFKFPETGKKHEYITKIYDLGKDLRKNLEKLAEELNSDLKNICLAAYIYTLSKFSYSKDITIGTITNTRPLVPDGDKLLGCFLNTVPFRAQVPNEGTWLEYIKYIDTKVRKLKAHERIPFTKILEIVDEPVTSENPIFDVAFNYIDFWIISEMLEHEKDQHLEEDPEDLNFATDNNDVNQNTLFDFHVITTNQAFNIIVEYSTSIMNKKLVDVFYESFKDTLIKFVNYGDEALNFNDISSEQLQFTLDTSFGDIENVEEGETLVSLFENQVLTTPNKIAVYHSGGTWTYQELSNISTKIAAYLQEEEGVKSGDLVGLMLEREAYLIPTLLGILKSGAAYVPLDPKNPVSRIELIIKNAQLKSCITRSKLIENWNTTQVSFIDLDKQMLSIINMPNTSLNISILENDLAYVIYTSGSTGIPKGVAIKHHSVVNLIDGVTQEIPFYQDDIILSITTISFDIFVAESLLPLTKGLTMVLANEEEQKDAKQLAELIVSKNIDMLQMTPSRLELLLLEKNKHEILNGVKTLMVSGEAFPEALLKKLKTYYKGNIYNLYGPTEATVFTTIKNITSVNTITIGKPIANTNVFILDEQGNELPEGIIGELCIEGEGLAHGYLNNKELTEEKFVVLPHLSAERIYKTGDLAKWNKTGELEYFGRIDHQVKIRGFRIELGEIENQLNHYHKIKQSVVLVKEVEGEKMIVAYYVSDGEITVSELRFYLAKYLPEYMIPSQFMCLQNLPLTPNGKVNRKILPSPVLIAGADYEPPANNIEKVIVTLWADILKLPIKEISVTKSFFDLGGHSLRAMNLINKLNKEFQKDFPLSLIFKVETVRGFAQFVSAFEESKTDTIVVENNEEYSF